MESAANLVEVVGGSHSILPVVVLKDVIAIVKLIWVSVGLFWLESISSSEGRVELEEIAVVSLRWGESLVVELWVSVQSSAVKSSLGSVVVVGSSSEESGLLAYHLSLHSLYKTVSDIIEP